VLLIQAHKQQHEAVAPAQTDVALLLSQLQEQADILLAAQRAMARHAAGRQKPPAAATVGKLAGSVHEAVAYVSKQQLHKLQEPAVVAAAVQRIRHAAADQHQRVLQHHNEATWLLLSVQQQGRHLQESVLPALAAAGAAAEAARAVFPAADGGAGGADAAATAEAALQHMLEAESHLADVLAANDSDSSTAALLQEAQLVCAAAATATRSVCETLLEVAGQLTACLSCFEAAAAPAAAGGAERAAEELAALASSVVEADATLQDRTKAVSSAAATLSRHAADTAAVLRHLQPAKQAGEAALQLMQQLEGQLHPAAAAALDYRYD
jgi:hypothetical protein